MDRNRAELRMRVCKYVLLTVNILLPAAGSLLLFTQTPKSRERTVFLIILLLFCALDIGYFLYFRKRFVMFSEEVCRNAERIMRNERDGTQLNKDTLTSKVVMELEKMEDILGNRLAESEQGKAKLQKTISEIAHQVKTPLSNVRMYHDMLSDPDIAGGDKERFMEIIRQQLEKLEFLIDSLIKSSRLESDMIKLSMENGSVFDTLGISVNGIVQKADRKKIDIAIHCHPMIKAAHDVKWTSEAIENILDNAVKYTPERGKIRIDVIRGEMYVEIKIQDTGKGIAAEHYNDIFKRFYREPSASKDEGLGLGLYIARNIITLQGGYIMVHSVLGQGSCFSLFLPD